MKVTKLRLALLGLILAGCATGLGHDREEAMETIGGAFKPIGAMAKAGTFDQAEVSEKAKVIAMELEHFGTLFPDASDKSGTTEKVWSDRAGFDAARNDARAAALELAAVTDAAAFPGAVKKLGDACGACHSTYRADF
ncbi:cytochrome c [Dongia rigui]|uniref:Cytochrome c n=1 Tax=Dongia rigui TaxID=940149 RepID=A0ABU5E0L1_9PROT|nr:cytochrome c [Dongia rigui]MDY0873126.1 cytochrome c [Dongia rigui]